MKHHKDSYNVSVSTVSTDLFLTDFKYRDNISLNTISEGVSIEDGICKNELKEPLFKYRYVVVFISFLVYTYLTIIRINMSINVVSMVNNSEIIHHEKPKSESCPRPILNITEDGKTNKVVGEFDWTPKIQGYILGSYYFGHFVTPMLSGLLAERYGVKWILFGATLVAGVCTLLIPVFSYLDTSALIALSVLRGFSQGLVQPAMAVLTATWFPETERGFVFSLAKSGMCLGFFLGSIFSGLLCESAGGWLASFYVTGAGKSLLALLILFFLVENPRDHPKISKAELNFILSNQENVLLRRRPKLPWRKILTSVPVYALAFAYFGQSWAAAQVWTVHSTFLATIHHYDIKQNGLLTAVPFGLQFLCSQIISWFSFYLQNRKACGVDFLRKFWTFLASVGISLSLLGMYLSGCNRNLSVIFSVLLMGCTGITYSGCWIVPTDMTPTFAGTIHAFCITLGLSSAFILPVVVGYLTDEMQTIEQWNKIFFISIAITMSSGIVFAIFGSADVQPWNFVGDKNEETNKTKSNEIKEKKNERKM